MMAMLDISWHNIALLVKGYVKLDGWHSHALHAYRASDLEWPGSPGREDCVSI